MTDGGLRARDMGVWACGGEIGAGLRYVCVYLRAVLCCAGSESVLPEGRRDALDILASVASYLFPNMDEVICGMIALSSAKA